MTTKSVDLKVVLLGKEFSGKTCLVERFLHNQFIERNTRDTTQHNYQATIGAAFASKSVQIGAKQVVLGIWDTAGSERFESMSRMYYRGARAAIICFDLTEEKSFLRAKFWTQELKHNEELCNIYLCGTKSDKLLSAQTKVDKQLILNFGHAIGARVCAQTSAKTGEGVEELFNKIVKDFVDFRMDFSEHNSEQSVSLVNDKNRKKNCCYS